MCSLTIATISRQASRATQAVANELAALHLNQQHLDGLAKHFANRANSQLPPFAPAGALLFASLKGVFGLAAAAH